MEIGRLNIQCYRLSSNCAQNYLGVVAKACNLSTLVGWRQRITGSSPAWTIWWLSKTMSIKPAKQQIYKANKKKIVLGGKREFLCLRHQESLKKNFMKFSNKFKSTTLGMVIIFRIYNLSFTYWLKRNINNCFLVRHRLYTRNFHHIYSHRFCAVSKWCFKKYHCSILKPPVMWLMGECVLP